ncbi:MAG: alkaline phosphatase family protein [Solirubrobacteraceae bacterium]
MKRGWAGGCPAQPGVGEAAEVPHPLDRVEGGVVVLRRVVAPYPNAGGLPGQSTVPLDNEFFAGKSGTPGGSDGVPGPYGLGVRVPMLVVSPWSVGGWVCSETFDHTSLVQLIEARFGVSEPNLTPWRRAVCGDLTSAFDFARADDRVPSLPSTDQYKPTGQPKPTYTPTPPAVGSVPKQEPGVRPSRGGSAIGSMSRSGPTSSAASSSSRCAIPAPSASIFKRGH